MKSGLEDRNNLQPDALRAYRCVKSLNEVRPGRPEQSVCAVGGGGRRGRVSMKSGLEGRNNAANGHAAIDTLRRVSMKSGLEGRNNRVGQVVCTARRDTSQ